MAKSKKRFFLILLLTILGTRLYVLSLFYFFRHRHDLIAIIINDPFHHYHLGLLFLLLSFLGPKRIRSLRLTAFGLGIILEELPVLMVNLGLVKTNYYLTGWDLIFSLGIVLFFYLLSKD